MNIGSGQAAGPMTPTSPVEVEHVEPSAIEAISRAEIDMAIATARRFPRQLVAVKGKMLSFATLDEETAEGCFYTLPRGGKNIQGPSVRLAEIAVACYGNLRAGTRIIQTVTTGDSPHVVIQAVAMDLENNISITIEKRRRITSKKDFKTGGRKPIDEDDINLATQAGSAIAFRDCVFKIVPGALIKPVYEAARKVAVGDAKSLVDRRSRSIATLSKVGVTPDRILAKLAKKSVEEIGVDDLEVLFGLFNAIKEGEITVEEAFPLIVKEANAAPVVPVAPPEKPKHPLDPQPTKPMPTPAPSPAAAAPAPANVVPLTPEPAESFESASPQPTEADAAPQTEAPDTGAPPVTEPPIDKPVAEWESNECIAAINTYARSAGVTDEQVWKHLVATKLVTNPQNQKQISELSTAKLRGIVSAWPKIVEKIKLIPA